MRVLVIDGDSGSFERLQAGLLEYGVSACHARDADEATAALRDRPCGYFELVYLELQLQGRSAWDLLRRFRAEGDGIPLLILTELHTSANVSHALRLGADDFVPKPFELDELVARSEAVLRRHRALDPIHVGGLRVDPAMRRVTVAGKPLELGPRDYDLLLVLARARGAAVSAPTLCHLTGAPARTDLRGLADRAARLNALLAPRGPEIAWGRDDAGYRLVVAEANARARTSTFA